MIISILKVIPNHTFKKGYSYKIVTTLEAINGKTYYTCLKLKKNGTETTFTVNNIVNISEENYNNAKKHGYIN